MIRHVKYSLLILFGIELLFTVILYFATSYHQLLFWIYAWIPGCIALFCAYQEKFRLTIFSQLNRYFYLALFIGTGISLFAFFCTILLLALYFFPFEIPSTLGSSLLYFLGYYLTFIIIFSFFFLGGELYWRGYLWEKEKTNPYRGVWRIALIWSLWMIPVALFSEGLGFKNFWLNLIWMIAFNFALTPILLYLRIRGRSIFTAVIAYASFYATPIYLRMLFPQSLSMAGKWIYASISLLLLVLYSIFSNLYSRKHWKHLANISKQGSNN